MSDRITPDHFRAAEGVSDWHVISRHVTATFETGDFATGLRLVNAIGELAEAANHHPDIELTYPKVVIRLMSHDVQGLSERDVALARQISAAAGDLGIEAAGHHASPD